jgi:hypothetical protein
MVATHVIHHESARRCKTDRRRPVKKHKAKLSEHKFRQLDAASGGGTGAPGPNGSNGGDGGGSEGGGAGGDTVDSTGTKGNREGGGNGGGGGFGGLGGLTGAFYKQGGAITAGVSGKNGQRGKTGGAYGSGGGGGGTGIVATGPLTIETATIKGGDGGASLSGPSGTGGNGGGGAGMAINGPGPVHFLPSAKVEGGSGAVSGATNKGADGGGGVGVYFDGLADEDASNILTNEGDLVGGSSVGGGGGAGVVLSSYVTLNNHGGTIRGGSSDRAAGPGVLMLGTVNKVRHTVAGGKIVGGSTNDAAAITAPGIRAEGDGNEVVTASQILGGVNAIEFVGPENVLELQSGYAFLGNVVCQGDSNELVFGGATDVTSFDLSSVGPVGSKAAFQGFSYIQKVAASTWTVSGIAPSSIDEFEILEGELKLVGSGDLSHAKQVTVGGSSVLDLSGIAADIATLPSVGLSGSSDIRLGAKVLVLAGGGKILDAATISGTGGVAIQNFQLVPLLLSGTIAAGPVAVRGRVVADGGTIADDVTIEAGGEIELGVATFQGNLTAGGKLIVADYGAVEAEITGRPVGTIKGNLRFLGPNSQLNSYLEQGGKPLDASVIEVSGAVSLNNVTVNIVNTDGPFGNILPGTYHLIHAVGGIGGAFTIGALPDSRCSLQVTDDKKYLQLVVS